MTVTLKNLRIFTGGYEVTADHYQGTLQRMKEAVKATVFGLDAHRYRDGLKTAAFGFDGYFDADGTAAVNDIQQAQYASEVSEVFTVVAPPAVAGDVAFSFNAVIADLTDFGGAPGDMAAFNVAGNASGDTFRGTVFEDAVTARSSSASSSGYVLGDVVAGETVYAALHVVAVTGSPTLDVVVESDTSGFPSPTTRITFPQATSVGAQFLISVAVTADTDWRTSWVFGGTGSVTFLVNVGIS